MRTRLRPLLSDWDWQERASCRGMNSATFYSPPGERGHARRKREEAARRICQGCEVMEECAAMALDYQERYGVWGGMSPRERENMRGSREKDVLKAA
ncbi:WhiB family transcriptional regulator [Streptomyces sp. VRA16 Mangrove soil]|uniref:WhiB family transcriptional regulator n=1 Tax=Streptomyces sp. VRA16 Mangrove soil TaxID=2817434 RepID=UPI001A9EE930|nr:WhiB family transcriptional regulator [Streptomyces sp. VRA16 Mangrove soil]MBO1334331.1 WhiB family transcriptional regulator [Streptomyces sp. VRA16 Mangrove soil]